MPAALSLAVMPLLVVAQRRAGRELGSASAVADSQQPLLCTCLSGVLLVGLFANSLLGFGQQAGDEDGSDAFVLADDDLEAGKVVEKDLTAPVAWGNHSPVTVGGRRSPP